MQFKLIVSFLSGLGLSLSMVTSVLAAPETYQSDPNHTFVQFEYNHLGFSKQTSRFNKVDAKITIDRVAKNGQADITIDNQSVDTGSSLFNTHIQGEDYLATEKFPTATFKSDKFIFKGDKLASIQGNLTLKGISKPVTLEVTNFDCKQHPMIDSRACGANAIANIKRSDFNMGKYVPYVSDDVKLNIAIEALKQ